MKNTGKRTLLRLAALAVAGISLSGCVYDVGLGYASDGYYDDYYCDPYGGYDSYYDCDSRSGFYNIGFGGGWYDNYWYPGYGYNLFDTYGRRYAMRDNHRRYWGEQRHRWYRERRGRDRDRSRDRGNYQGRGRGYTDNATPGTIGWPERNGGRVRDDARRGRGDGQGRRQRSDQWRGGDGYGADAVPVPNPDAVQRPGRGRERGEGFGRPGRRGDGGVNAVIVEGQDRPDSRQGGDGGRMRGEGDGQGRAERQPRPAPAEIRDIVPVAQPEPQPIMEPVRQQSGRRGMIEGAVERPQ